VIGASGNALSARTRRPERWEGVGGDGGARTCGKFGNESFPFEISKETEQVSYFLTYLSFDDDSTMIINRVASRCLAIALSCPRANSLSCDADACERACIRVIRHRLHRTVAFQISTVPSRIEWKRGFSRKAPKLFATAVDALKVIGIQIG